MLKVKEGLGLMEYNQKRLKRNGKIIGWSNMLFGGGQMMIQKR